MDELEQLDEYADNGRIELEYVERPPARSDRRRYSGSNDAIIRAIAFDYDALLFIVDLVQSRVARAKGIDVEYVEPYTRKLEELPIKRFSDDETMSVHLKADAKPMAKRGSIGEMHYQVIREELATEDELKGYAHDILDDARRTSRAFIEDRLGIDIDVRTHGERQLSTEGGEVDAEHEIPVEPEFTRHHVVLPVDSDPGETVKVRVDGEYLFTATVGRGGEIQVSRGTAIAEELERAIDMERQITAVSATD